MNQSKGKARPKTSNRNMSRAVQRGESLSLTGGTNDVKPQYLSFVASQSGSDATTTTTQALPVLRNFQTGGNRAQIVEILKVYFTPDDLAEVDGSLNCFLTTKNLGTVATNASEASVIANFTIRTRLTTSGLIAPMFPFVVDLTDGDGNGILVATDNIYAQVSSTTTSLTNSVRVKVLYRIYGASVTEYVGIVQSQQ